MKSILVFLLVLSTCAVMGAPMEDTILRVTEMPPNGFQLLRWKAHAGDNPAYAYISYDDRKWNSIIPAVSVHDLPANIVNNGGWLRLKFQVNSVLMHNIVLYTNTPAAGAELYFNGHLLERRGQIDPIHNMGHAVLTSNPISLPIIDTGVQVLAIRYAPDPFVRHMNSFTIVLSSAYLAGLEQITYREKRSYGRFAAGFLSIGVLLLLTVFHLILYYNYRTDKGNLYFAAFTFCFAMSYLLGYIDTSLSLPQAVLLNFSVSVCRNLLYYFEIKALNNLFGFRFKTLAEWILAALTTLTFIFTFIDVSGIWIDIVSGSVPIMIFLLIVKALAGRKPGALIIAPGFFVSFVSYALLIYLDGYGNAYGIDAILSVCVTATIALGSSLSLSIFLSSEAGKKSLKLQQLLIHQNELLEQKVEERTVALKLSQNQLIQAEKMASLGELTAGIAHEIQNPLNFVNNFSELSAELMGDMDEELEHGDVKEARLLCADVKQNLEKITHHGKRADAIVKSMLEHSRVSSGQREQVNLNRLADEYARIVYNGLRAKDNSFSTILTTVFDENLPAITVIPQDIGRVIVNLLNNAFYAVTLKKNSHVPGFMPHVTIRTAESEGKAVITVEDNGVGVPGDLKSKIMQPFFTTKPTGEGVGLGLSLCYDIVAKGHNGTLSFDSVGNEYSNFIIELPII